MPHSVKAAACVLFVLGLALGIRVYQLGHENFWVDEVAYVQDASQTPHKIIDFAGAPRTRVHHVTAFPHLLVHYVILAAPSETAARLPSAIFGTLETMLLFVLGSCLFSFRVGFLAALFLAVSPLHLWYSQEARWYAQWSFLTTCSYLALFYAWKQDRLSAWLGYGLTTLLNLYTFVYSVLVIGIQTVSVFASYRQSNETCWFRKYFATHACVIAGSLPIFWMILRGLEKSSGTPRSEGWGDLPYTFFTYTAGFTAGPTLAELHALPDLQQIISQHWIVLVFLIVFLPAVILGIRETLRNATASALVLPWLIGLPLLVFVIAAFSNLTYQVRYTLPALPAFVLILARGVLSLKSKAATIALLCGIVSCSAYSLSNFYWDMRYDKEQVRAATARIDATNGGSSMIVAIGQIGRTVRYYANGHPVVAISKAQCSDRAAENIIQQKSLPPPETVWVIAGRDWKDRTTVCLAQLSQSYSIVEHHRFVGTNLWQLKMHQ